METTNTAKLLFFPGTNQSTADAAPRLYGDELKEAARELLASLLAKIEAEETEPGTIKLRDVTPKPHRFRGELVGGINSQGIFHANIVPRKSIRIFGVMTNHVNGPQLFDRTFKLGDEAEHGSYNFVYTGAILAIGPKTVTISTKDIGGGRKMFEVFGFIDRNWNFDAEKIAADNLQTSYSI